MELKATMLSRSERARLMRRIRTSFWLKLVRLSRVWEKR